MTTMLSLDAKNRPEPGEHRIDGNGQVHIWKPDTGWMPDLGPPRSLRELITGTRSGAEREHEAGG